MAAMKKNAAHCQANAQTSLGRAYERGASVHRNAVQAVAWYRKPVRYRHGQAAMGNVALPLIWEN